MNLTQSIAAQAQRGIDRYNKANAGIDEQQYLRRIAETHRFLLRQLVPNDIGIIVIGADDFHPRGMIARWLTQLTQHDPNSLIDATEQLIEFAATVSVLAQMRAEQDIERTTQSHE